MARTIDMALSRLDDAAKAERWQWGVGKRSGYAKIADHIAGLQQSDLLKDPDTIFCVDCTGVGKAVGSMLTERGMHFEPVTWTSGDSFKHHHSDG